MTIDEMIAAIEQRVCVRKIWRCNAGWGMFTIPLYAVEGHRKEMETWYERRLRYGAAHPRMHGDAPPEPESIVNHYYPSLEECVRSEYAKHCTGRS